MMGLISTSPTSTLFSAIGISGYMWSKCDVLWLVQGAKGHYKGIGDCVSKIIKEEGASALLKVSLLLPLPFV